MTPFNPQRGLIVVRVTLFGPLGNRAARLALDTGASSTLVSKQILTAIGYNPDALPKTVTFTTGSQVEAAARVAVDKLKALDQERQTKYRPP